jgi:4-amino-4-deoxy-L-arabinose transferase-like glycosyltransferase
MPVQFDNLRRGYVAIAVLLTLVAVLRVLSSYSHTAQAFDEPYHVAAAIELLDKGTYTLDPLHPPLERIAIGLPLYLAGERLPNISVSESDASTPYLCAVGNAILNDGGHYARNLMLARLGILPFLLLGCIVVFLWARQEYGDFAGVAAVGLFTTLPVVLEFSGIAYTDMVAASTQAVAFWAFATWLEKRSMRSTVWLGIATGLALLSKFTTLIYLPAAALSMVALQWSVLRFSKAPRGLAYKQMVKQVLVGGAIAVALLWAGYGFAVGPVREGMQISTASIPSFQHFPGPVARIARRLILSDPKIPVPALMRGVAMAWVKEKTEPTGYLLGHIKSGGWWYFFLVGVGVKTPVPFLILVVAGLFCFKGLARKGRWTTMAPAACALAILLVTLPVKINYGIRHVLVIFPLLAIVAGYGCSYLWHLNLGHLNLGHLKGRGRAWGRAALIVLLLWQGVSTVRASADYTAYFNEIAGKDPSRVLVAGCDLDCGQDIFALSRELHQRNISHATLALWTSADMSKMDLPKFDVAQPYRPVAGWFAISLRALREGDLFHSSYPPDAFAWISRYQPVTYVGKTILLYHIPEDSSGSESK